MSIYLGKAQGIREKQIIAQKQEKIHLSQAEQTQQLTSIYQNFQTNLHQFASKYKEDINKDPDFREKFNDMCDKMDVNPMLSRKTMWTDLGFGDFYNELALKILDICAKKKYVNGGIMKFNDIISEYQLVYKSKISRKDIQRSLKTIDCLGGCQIMKDYVCTAPVELGGDTSLLLEVAEEYGYISQKIMHLTKGWTQERFNSSTEVLRREGLIWVDKKTGTNELHFYFASMLNNFINQKSLFKKL